MNRKLVLLSLALLAMLTVSAFPVKAWVYPGGSEDGKFELYGPHIKGILIKLYNGEAAEWAAMDNDLLDFEDTPLDATQISAWQGDPRFQLSGYGAEQGFYIFDLNKNNDLLLGDGTTNPAIDSEMGINVMSIKSLRQALACLVNRGAMVGATGGLGMPIYTPVPVYMASYVHPDIVPGGTLDYLTYGGYNGDVAKAVQYLNDDGFLYNPAEYPWRFYDENSNGVYDTGEEFTLTFVDNVDNSLFSTYAGIYNTAITSAPICINTAYFSLTKFACSGRVMEAKDFHIYTGSWLYIGPDPDYLYDLYHSSMYWHPGKPPNYGGGIDSILDWDAEQIKFATSIATALSMTYLFQEDFAKSVWGIPVYCMSGVKAYRKKSVEEGGAAQWLGVVNQVGFGVNSWWTFLNLMKECEYYPDVYATYGFATPTIEWRNPFYAQWYWDWEFIGKIYDSCARRNPYDLGLWVPQLAKSWEVGLWKDPNTQEMKSKVRITLRPDIVWSDGVPITIADLTYTFVESVNDLIGRGLPAPSWYPVVQFFRSFFIIDPMNVEILLDVKSLFAVCWVLNTIVIPRHIWYEMTAPWSQQDVYTAQPDPFVIGSGPFKYVSYTPNVNAVLDANPLYYQYCPVHVNLATLDYMFKNDPGYPNTVTNVYFEVNVFNLWQNGSSAGFLDGTKYIFVDGVPYLTEYLPCLRSSRPAFGNPKMVLEVMGSWNPAAPIGSTWYELQPIFSWGWTCTSWFDSNGNGIADYCDWLDFQGAYGNVMYAHVFTAGSPYLELDYYEIYNCEEFTLPLTKCKHQITVAFHIESPTMLDDLHPNPWICQWINVTIPVWVTIKQDVGGASYQGQVVAPDCKVDGKDIAYATSAFNTVPGMRRWNSVADVTADYKVDGKDVANIAKYYGKW
jgi:ABC-type transport system substrate-binding protein